MVVGYMKEASHSCSWIPSFSLLFETALAVPRDEEALDSGVSELGLATVCEGPDRV